MLQNEPVIDKNKRYFYIFHSTSHYHILVHTERLRSNAKINNDFFMEKVFRSKI